MPATDNTTATNTPHLETPTGLRVRADLYDEDYSDTEYQDMLALYEGTMSQIVEGEIVKSKILRVTDNIERLPPVTPVLEFLVEHSTVVDEEGNVIDLTIPDEPQPATDDSDDAVQDDDSPDERPQA